MITRKVPDIRLRCYDNNNQLIWKSLRGENIKAGGEWRPILPGKYRLSHEGYWYEFAPLELEMYLAWSPYPNTGTPTDIEIICKVPKDNLAPENIHMTLTKADENNPILKDTLVEVGTSENVHLRLIRKYSANPVSVTYKLDDNKNLSTSTIARYTINTDSITLPYLDLRAKGIEFGMNADTNRTSIIATTGDIQYADIQVSNTASWIIDNPDKYDWITPTKVDNDLVVSVIDNPTSVTREGILEISHSVYPFIKSDFKVTQGSNQGPIVTNPSWSLLYFDFNNPKDGTDVDIVVFFNGSGTLLDGKKLGYNQGLNLSGGNYEEILFWGGDVRSNLGDHGENVAINWDKFANKYRDSTTSPVTISLYAYGRGGNATTLNYSFYKGGTLVSTPLIGGGVITQNYSISEGVEVSSSGKRFSITISSSAPGTHIGDIIWTKGLTREQDTVELKYII